MPLNNKLMAIDPADADADTRSQIERWGGLPAVRSALGTASALAFVIALAA